MNDDQKPTHIVPKPAAGVKEVPYVPRLNGEYSPIPFNGDPYYIGGRGVPTRPPWWDR